MLTLSLFLKGYLIVTPRGVTLNVLVSSAALANGLANVSRGLDYDVP